MYKIHTYTVVGTLFCLLLTVIFFAQFSETHFFGIAFGNPGEYSVLQLISLFYNAIVLFFLERIRHFGKFYIANSADCFPCLTTTAGILASFWALVLAISLVNARDIFIQTGLFFLFSFVQTICLLISSCCKQIKYDNLAREILVENGQIKNGDLYVNYDVASKQDPKCLSDKGTKTENEVLNVVELNDKQSDEFLKIQKWAEQLSKARGSMEFDSVAVELVQEMKHHFGDNPDVTPRPSVDVSVGLERSPKKVSYDLTPLSRTFLDDGSSSSSTSSLLSLIPENTLVERF